MDNPNSDGLPSVPLKRYFTIGEVSELCGVKSHVLRYWEQEFPKLNPTKRRGNRRYYQYKDVLLVREIKRLLHSQGYTISGARQKLESSDFEGTTSKPLHDFIKQTIKDLEGLAHMLE